MTIKIHRHYGNLRKTTANIEDLKSSSELHRRVLPSPSNLSSGIFNICYFNSHVENTKMVLQTLFIKRDFSRYGIVFNSSELFNEPTHDIALHQMKSYAGCR